MQIENQNICFGIFIESIVNDIDISINELHIIISKETYISICSHQRIVSVKPNTSFSCAEIHYVISMVHKLLYFVSVTLITYDCFRLNIHLIEQSVIILIHGCY